MSEENAVQEAQQETAPELEDGRVQQQHNVFITCQNIMAIAGLNGAEAQGVAMHLLVTHAMDGHETQAEGIAYLEAFFSKTMEGLKFDALARTLLPAGTVANDQSH